MYVGVCVYLYTYVCGCMHVWHACMGKCVSVLGVCVDSPSFLGVWWHVTVFQTRSDDLNSVIGDSDLYPIWTRYTGDSKADLWDDL